MKILSCAHLDPHPVRFSKAHTTGACKQIQRTCVSGLRRAVRALQVSETLQSLAKPASPLVCSRQKFYLASRPGVVSPTQPIRLSVECSIMSPCCFFGLSTSQFCIH